MKKLKENIFPTEALYRSPELEYIRYRNEQNVKSRNYDMLRRMIPGILLGNLIKPLALMVTDPDKQTIDLPMTIWDKNKNDDNQGTEVNFLTFSYSEDFAYEDIFEFSGKFSILLLFWTHNHDQNFIKNRKT